MSLIYVTGVSGSGKSTVQARLQELGYAAYDVDDPELSGVFENATGKKVSMPPVEQRTPEWSDEHSWLIIPEAIKGLKAKSESHTIFLCGAARNDKDFWHLLNTVICLDIDEATLRQRIADRQNNDYGKSSHELQSILDWHKKATAGHKKLGAHIIDASQPLDVVIKEILRLVNY